MTKARIIRLSERSGGNIRFLSRCPIELAEGKTTSNVTVTRTGSFTDPRYGRFEISRGMLLGMVDNFKSGAYGQDIFIDVDHKPGDGAAGKIVNLSVEGNRLRAEVEWTPYGVEAIKNKGYQYLSAEYTENFTDNEAGNEHGPLLLGAALTVRPVIKHLDPVRLSEASEQSGPLLLHPELIKQLSEELDSMYKEFIKRLAEALKGMALAEPVVVQLCAAFEITAKELGEDKAKLESLFSHYQTAGKNLAEQIGDKVVKLSIEGFSSAGKTLSEEDVKRLLAEDREKRDNETRQLAEKRDANVKLFDKLLSEAKALEGLDENAKKTLSEAADLITADMTPEQVTKLAEHQIKLGSELSVNVQLANLGYQPAGSVRITQSDQRTASGLQQSINQALKLTAEYDQKHIVLAEKLPRFCQAVLNQFDVINAPAIAAETKRLAGGETGIGDTNLPIGFQRTVIMEALSDLRVLELVQTLTDFSATATTQIPYEQRDTSAVLNNGIVFEGQGIHRASISQAMDTAYILPMKLAFLISNEVIHFSRSSGINWDAYARNVASNARFMRELIVRRICNELQRAADRYGAVSIVDESITAQLTGSVDTVKTAQFPIVRQHQQYDLQGNAVGSVVNPITVKLNNVAISEYDGSGTQAAGTYYRIASYNLGYIQFVDETGTPATPLGVANDLVSYDYATNVAKFDLDNGSVDIAVHLNGLLRTVGRQKAILASTPRFVTPDFMLMSPVLNDTVTNADQFTESSAKNGTMTNAAGDLETIKNVPSFATNAPSTDLGEERLIMGQRGTLTYTISKPFQTGAPFEAVDANGKAIGKKQAYGEEYSAIKVPEPIKNRLTSVLAYSATGR